MAVYCRGQITCPRCLRVGSLRATEGIPVRTLAPCQQHFSCECGYREWLPVFYDEQKSVMKDVFGQELNAGDIVIEVSRVTKQPDDSIPASINYLDRLPLGIIRANPGDDTRFRIIKDGDREIVARPR